MNHEAYLRSALIKYRYPDPTRLEAMKIFKAFTDLRPHISEYVFNDGVKKELLLLGGTIPITYKGKTYNIPISIYLLDTHPYNPPLVYVKPTPSMVIRQGKHVDATGRVYLPYLHAWKHPQSDLMGLIQVMIIIFAEEPPVFSKPQTAPPGPAASADQGSVRPPYPVLESNMPTPMYGQPPYPTGPTPYATNNPFPQPYPQTNMYRNYAPPSNNQAPYPNAGPISFPPINHALLTATTSMNISEEEKRLSLLSAVEDRMKRRLREILAQGQAEMDALKKTQEDLEKGRQKLDEMLQKIEREQMHVENSIQTIQCKETELSQALEHMKVSEDVPIDDIISPSAPLYKQLLNSFAEEQAIDDAIYYMSEALRKGVLDLDVFLKQVRELYRKKFMLRMIIDKCRDKAGLPEYDP